MSLHRSQHRQRRGEIPGFLFVFLLACGLTHRSVGAAIPAAPLNAQQPGTALLFYAQPEMSPEMSEDLWPVLFQAVRADLSAGAGDLPDGLILDRDPILVRGNQNLLGVTFPRVISVKLLGRCDGPAQINRRSDKGPLGWVMLVSGKIQPFVSIDCTRIAQVLRPATAGLDKRARQYAMVQAITHVLIHEWSHIVTQSSSHSSRGITQANLSLNDLIQGPAKNHLAARNR